MKPVLQHIFFRKYSLIALAGFLYLASVVYNSIYTRSSSVSREIKTLERYLHKQQRDFHSFLADTALIRKLAEKKESQQEFESLVKKNYGIYVIAKDFLGATEMKFWSKQYVIPPADFYLLPDSEYFEHLSNGYYLIAKKTISIPGFLQELMIYAMFPVESDYFIQTDYLPQQFFYSKKAARKIMISSQPNGNPVHSLTGKTIFYLAKKSAIAHYHDDWLTITLRFISLFLLLLFIHFQAESVVKKKNAWLGISVLAASLIVLRMLIYFFPAFLNLRQFELFDPSIYGSNIVQRSLGDLLINAVLFCWLILFAWSKLQDKTNFTETFKIKYRRLAGGLALAVLILSTFLLSTVIRSMVADSKISFDVTDFFSLNQYSVFGFVVLACLSFSYYYLTQLLFRFIFPLFEGRTYIVYMAIAFTGLVYLTLISGKPVVLFYLPVLLWLLLYTWLVNKQGLLLHRFNINIAASLFWIFVFSASISAIMLAENRTAEWERRKIFASKLAEQTDPSSERLLNIALQYLDRNFLNDNFYRFYDSVNGKALRDSIINENYRGYLNKYDTRLYVFDANGRPLYNDDSTSYNNLNTILSVNSKQTRLPGIYYYETAFDKFTYITRREVTDGEGQKKGSLFIISNPKKYSSDALFPELFRQLGKNDPESNPVYSYAIYSKGKLVFPSNKYPFQTSLTTADLPQEEFKKKQNGDYDELWYKAGNDKVIVIARKRDTFIETITLFSYIFCSFLFLVAFVQVISLIIKTGYDRRALKNIFQFNIRSQVHATIIFISLFSFLIIGFAIISFFISRYNRINSDKLSRTMKIMVNEMQKKQADHNTFDDVIRIYDTVSNFTLQKLVADVADIHGVDVNVYDLDGNLKVSSESNVYRKGVLSNKMNPEAYFHLSRLRQVQHAQEEKIADISYLSIYAPVRDEDGNVSAYLNIPYFSSQKELNQEISNFLVTIINLNAFIFLIAGIIALFITNRITHSFSLISQKMREVNLGKLNEAINWNREDEIGELVKEYNKMVSKLEDSAAALAKSEREGAWREMARQVAHEIKNPLTPMKLSIQYLQKAIQNNQPNVRELSAGVVKTLVEQIDHLSKIAADFSQFANIGNPSPEQFDLHDVLYSLTELYKTNPNVVIEWDALPDKIMLHADKTQMNRLFTNLFANAVEACNGNGICKIEVYEKQVNGTIQISVKDNGDGIAPEMQSKIFVPNFTTKSSGTGLGLAMCKGIVEKAGGKIWFETGKGRGTIFHVELPLANLV